MSMASDKKTKANPAPALICTVLNVLISINTIAPNPVMSSGKIYTKSFDSINYLIPKISTK